MSTRPDHSAGAYLWDALHASRNVGTILTGVPIEQYVGDLLRESATERQMEIVGEALSNIRRIDQALAERVPNVHKIIGMRNVLVHGYATVNSLTVWTAATKDVPALMPVLEQLLAEFDERQGQGFDSP